MERNSRKKFLNVALFVFVLATNVHNIEAKCSDGDIQVDATDCTAFYVCCGGELVLKSCESGLYFDQDARECKPDNGQCIATPVPDCGGKDPSTPGDEDSSTPAECKDYEVKVDPQDCTMYYICDSGVFVKRECVSGSYFNDVIGVCTPDDKGVCIPTPAPDCDETVTQSPSPSPTPEVTVTVTDVTQSPSPSPTPDDDVTVTQSPIPSPTPEDEVSVPPPTCTEGDKIVNAQDCASYFICNDDNEEILKICGSGDYFDKSALECVPDVNGTCIPYGSDSECEGVPNNGLVPISGNCSGFYQCLYGKVIAQSCPNNLHFNNVIKQCDYPENAGCEWPSSNLPSTGPSGTSCESHGVCLGQPDGSLFASSENACSSKYIVCQCECEINLSCDSSLMFNARNQTCDWPDNFGC